MEKVFEVARTCPLFAEIEEAELHALLKCLCASKKTYKKNQLVFAAGESVPKVGMVLLGAVHVMQEDFWGNRTIFASIGPGGLFGEAFSCAEVEKLPVSVLAVQDSTILLLDYQRIVRTCSSACIFHATLIKNMLRILAGKNVMLTQKIELLTRRTTREKLLSFLSSQAQQAGSNRFQVPFNRQELAEYLSVDRSAMSNELSKMQKDGIVSFHKNQFELLKNPGH